VGADPRYRAAKLATVHAVLPASLRGERDLLRVDLRDADGREHPDVPGLLVASNCYELNGVRERLDAGVLQVSALRARTGAALAGLATRALARGGPAPGGRPASPGAPVGPRCRPCGPGPGPPWPGWPPGPWPGAAAPPRAAAGPSGRRSACGARPRCPRSPPGAAAG